VDSVILRDRETGKHYRLPRALDAMLDEMTPADRA